MLYWLDTCHAIYIKAIQYDGKSHELPLVSEKQIYESTVLVYGLCSVKIISLNMCIWNYTALNKFHKEALISSYFNWYNKYFTIQTIHGSLLTKHFKACAFFPHQDYKEPLGYVIEACYSNMKYNIKMGLERLSVNNPQNTVLNKSNWDTTSRNIWEYLVQ